MRFSIAIPAYKDKFLKEAVDSVLAQTFTDFEVIILDDNSPYDLHSIVSEYDDPRIRYYRNEKNVGALDVVLNWNKCLELSQGEFIICMGDDDCLCPDSLMNYNRYIDKYPECSLFHGATEMINEESQIINIQEARPERESVYSMAWHRLMRKREQYIGDFLFRTESLRKCGGFYYMPLAWASDDLSAFTVAFENGVVNTSEVVFRYRINTINITSTGGVEYKLEAVEKEKEWYKAHLLGDNQLSELDAKYRYLIGISLDRCFRRKYISTYAEGFSRSFGFLYKNLKRFGLGYKDLCVAFLLFIGRRAGVR